MQKFRLAALLFSVSAVSGCIVEDIPPAKVGGMAPEISAMDMDQNDIKLADYKGKTVLLSFWFTGCGPCQAELPILNAFKSDAERNDIQLLAINMHDGPEAIRSTARRMDLQLKLIADNLNITSKRYAVKAAPTNIVIGKNGEILQRIDGQIDVDFLYDDLIGKLAKH